MEHEQPRCCDGRARGGCLDEWCVGEVLKLLAKALAGSEGWRLPDLRPLPSACFRAFLLAARSWNKETDLKVRAELAPRLVALADAAGDILDGLKCDEREPPRWAGRADLS